MNMTPLTWIATLILEYGKWENDRTFDEWDYFKVVDACDGRRLMFSGSFKSISMWVYYWISYFLVGFQFECQENGREFLLVNMWEESMRLNELKHFLIILYVCVCFLRQSNKGNWK